MPNQAFRAVGGLLFLRKRKRQTYLPQQTGERPETRSDRPGQVQKLMNGAKRADLDRPADRPLAEIAKADLRTDLTRGGQ
jgi:hypothetical protein